MKLLGVIRDNNYLEYLDNGLDGMILPLESFSVDYFKYYSISDIKECRKSTDKLLVENIRTQLKANEGYCPCKLEKTSSTKCICQEFREQADPGPCHCGLYYKEWVKE